MSELRELREEAGFTQSWAAVLFGVSKDIIYNWEDGRTPPPQYAINCLRVMIQKDRKIDDMRLQLLAMQSEETPLMKKVENAKNQIDQCIQLIDNHINKITHADSI